MAHGLELIDWSAPWLAPWRLDGQAVAQRVARGESCANALNAQNQGAPAGAKAQWRAPRTFVPQAQLPAGVAYEQFIFDTHQVPTRDGLHDFFNGLCWLRFPQAKQRLNALQAAQIAATGIQPVRGPARDALTVVDENAAILVAPEALWQALQAKDWHRLFVSERQWWADSRLILFGHALLEKLVAPRKAITAHVYRATIEIGPANDEDILLRRLDHWLAHDFSATGLAAKPFAHLPVLGVPGWWPANEDPAFYADLSVFRPPRQNP